MHGLIRPGGSAYIDNFIFRAHGFHPRYWINRWTGLKLGHSVPPPGRLEKLFSAFVDLDPELIQRTPRSERMLLTRRSG